MVRLFIAAFAALSTMALAESKMMPMTLGETMRGNERLRKTPHVKAYTNKTKEELFRIRNMVLSSNEGMEEEKKARAERNRKRSEKFRASIKQMKPDIEQLSRVSPEDMDEEHIRRTGWSSWGGSSASGQSYAQNSEVDAGEEYDKWAQGYRMLGGYIDCDNQKDEGGSGDSGDNNNDDIEACSRWMLWSAYVNPNYEGNGYDEYNGDDAVGVLDCHSKDSEWELLGVYRQEFYQFIEQISKHVWAIDDYEYTVALAGLAYMTDDDCFEVGADSSGNALYGGIQPREGGYFDLALYSDTYCVTENTNSGYTFDSFDLQNDPNIYEGSGSNQDDDADVDYGDDITSNWYSTQEASLTLLNEVYDTFRYCTSCMDYPTYQDGYFIGDYGTDDDDVINQCWKFYSHDSYTCGADCISKGHSQNTILPLAYGGVQWGQASQSYYQNEEVSSANGDKIEHETKISRLMSNVFVTASFIIFIATFLAFAVARRSRHRESRSSKSRRLLGDDGRRRRRKSVSRKDGDGVWRESPRKRSSSRGTSRSKSSRSGSKTRRSKEGEYRAPSSSRKAGERSASKSRSKSRSRREDSGASSRKSPSRHAKDDF